MKNNLSPERRPKSAPTVHKILRVTARAGCCLPVFDLVRYLFDLDLNIYINISGYACSSVSDVKKVQCTK